MIRLKVYVRQYELRVLMQIRCSYVPLFARREYSLLMSSSFYYFLLTFRVISSQKDDKNANIFRNNCRKLCFDLRLDKFLRLGKFTMNR